MNSRSTSLNFVAGLGLASLALLPAQSVLAQESAPWDWSFMPYLMVTSIDGDTAIGRTNGIPVEVDFDTILENLELAFMMRAEARHESGWGVMLDWGFMDLENDKISENGGVLETDLHQGIFELAASYRISEANGYWDLMAGVRWWNNEIDVRIDPAVLPGEVNLNVDEDWVDPFFGARRMAKFADNWWWVATATVGGFDIASDFTWSGELGLIHDFSDRTHLYMAYKAMGVDYDDGAPGEPGYFLYDTVTHGPIVGLRFDF